MEALQIILGVLDFSLMTADILMTGICIALVVKDIREKKRLASQTRNHASGDS